MKPKLKSLEKSDRGFDAKTFWRHYVATVDTDQEWTQERPQQGRTSNRLFLILLLFHIFLIGSVVLFNLVSERPKPVFVDNSAPMKTVIAKKAPDATRQTPSTTVITATKEGETVEHRVAQGDSMKSIADASGATQEEIARMNHIDVNTQLAVGSVLRVPKPKAKAAPSVVPTGLQPSRVDEKLVVVRATTAPTSTTMFAAVEPASTSKKAEPAPAPKKTETVASKLPEDKPKPKVEDSPPSAPKPKPKAVAKVEEAPPAAKSKSTDSKAIARTETVSTPTAKAPETAKSAEPATSKPAVSTKTHTVKPGETFYSISRKYGIKVDDLMRANSATDPGKLRDGIVLKVPGKG